MKKILIVLAFCLAVFSCQHKENPNKNSLQNDVKTETRSTEQSVKQIPEEQSAKQEIRELVDKYSYNDYKVELYEIRNSKENGMPGEKRILTVYKNDKKVYEIFDDGTTFLHIDIKGKDITGNGKPNMVITDFTGGSHCCFQLVILELGHKFKKLLDISNDVEPELKDLDGDGIYEVIHRDDAFNYWHTSAADSPFPQYILRFKNGKYITAKKLMKQKPPSNNQLKKLASTTKLDDTPWDSNGDNFDNPELFRIMLNFIYSGNEKSAWKFLDMVWPESKPGKKQFITDFKEVLNKSKYWK